MSVATSCITDRFKNTFIRLAGEDTTDIQKALFRMGFRWHGTDRNLRNDKVEYIRVDEDGNMWLAGEGGGLTNPNDAAFLADKEYKEVFRNDILNSAEQVRKIKRKESKEQKKRAAKRKWTENALYHTRGWMPEHLQGELVAVMTRAGIVLSGYADNFRWKIANLGGDILSYKLLKKNTHKQKPEIVALEDFFAAVAHDIGKGVAIPVHDMGAEEAVSLETSEAPDTNPKRQYGVASVPLNMWSPLASAYGSLGLYNGALKYGKANFANTPVEASIYIAAAFRHLSAWACGQEFDPADGVPNLGGVLANIAILLEARAAGTLIDDRLKMAGYLKEIEQLKEIVKHLNELHEGKNPKHYTRKS